MLSTTFQRWRPESRGKASRWHPLVLAILLAMSLWLVWLQGDYPNDDCYIHLRIVRNMVEHGEFAYNRGEPAFTTTSPAWNLLVAGICVPVRALVPSSDYLRCSQAISFALVVLLVVLIQRRMRTDMGWWAWLPGGLVCIDPYVVGAVASATELPLFGVIAVLGAGWVREGKTVSAALAFSLLPQVRPEGWPLAAVAGLALLLREPFDFRRACRFAGLVALFVIPWLAFYRMHFGAFAPNSVVAKSLDSSGRLPFTQPDTMRQVARLFLQVYGLPCAVLVGVLYVLWRRGRMRDFMVAHMFELLAVSGVMFLYLAFLKEKVVSSRYLVTISPFLLMLLSVALAHALSRIAMAFASAALLGLFMALNLLALPVRNERGRVYAAERMEIGLWLNQNTSSNKVVFTGDIGYIGYYADRRIVDDGLADASGLGWKLRSGEISLQEYLALLRPDYFVGGASSAPTANALLAYECTNRTLAMSRGIWMLRW